MDSDTDLLSWTESNDSTTATILVPVAVSASTTSSPDLSSSTNDERDHDTNTLVSSESSYCESESLSIAASTFSTDIPPEDLSGRVEAPPQRYNGRGVDLSAPGQGNSVNGKDSSVMSVLSESSYRESESLSIAASTFSTDIPPGDSSGRVEAPPQRYNGRGVEFSAPGEEDSVKEKDSSVMCVRTKEEKVAENEINRSSTEIITFSEVEHRQCVEQLRIELDNMRQHNARPFDQDTENIYTLIDHALNHLARKDRKIPFTLSKRLLECCLVQLRDLKDYEKNIALSDRSSQIYDILLGLFGAVENEADLQSCQMIYGQY